MSRIQEYIDKHTSLAIRQRAKDILQSNFILSCVYHPKQKIVKATVRGNEVYAVTVDLSRKVKIVTDCNCPFDWGGLCKHEVAVLMKYDAVKDVVVPNDEGYSDFFNDEIDEDEYDEDEDDYDEDEEELPPAIIPEYQDITSKTINTISNRGSLYKAKLMIDDVEIDGFDEESTIDFIVGDKSGYYSTDEFVTFSLTKNGLEADCDCDEYTSFCSHIIAVLLFANIKNDNPAFFNFLDKKSRIEEMTSFAARYGITGLKDIENILEIEHNSHQLYYKFIDKYEGLQPIEEKQLEHKKLFLQKKRKELFDVERFLPAPILEEDQPSLGFGVVFTFEDGTACDTLLAANCITGRLNKTGAKMISNFNYLKLEHHPDINENQKQVLEITSKMKKFVNVHEDGLQDIHETFALLKELFNHLDEETHTFIQEKETWFFDASEKPRKVDLDPIHFSTVPFHIEYEVECDMDFIMLIPVIILGDNRIKLKENIIPVFFCDYFFIKYKETLFLANDISAIAALIQYHKEPIPKMMIDHSELFIREIVLPITENFEVNFAASTKIKQEIIHTKSMKKKLYISGMGQFVMFKPFAKYADDIEINILKNGTHVSLEENTIKKLKRDQSAENEFYALMKSLHPKLNKQFPEEFFHLEAKDMMKDQWFFIAFDRLSQADVEVFGLNELKNFNYNPKRAQVKVDLSSGQDWFDVKIEVTFGDLNVSLTDVRKAVLKKDRFIKLSDGSLGILPEEWFTKFGRMFRHGEIKDGNLKISNRKFMIVDELFDEIDDEQLLKELHDKRKKLDTFTQIKSVKIPATITADLRAYQKEGLNWLNFLDRFGWGGILADDMGLGKTLQILTFIACQKSQKASLIVVPTTLMFNWENEIEKFYPSLKVYFHYGPNRQKTNDQFKKHKLVITTYGMVISDIEWVKNHSFNYVILDESQAIKNPQSLRFKAVCLLKAKNRITLTGTPIENNTFDLFAQMHFVNPGLLGTAKSFRDNYSLPIDKNGDKERAEELRKMINPFLIRRTKEQVATELPPKTDEILYCYMEKDQRKVYDAYRNKYRDMLLGRIKKDGLEKSKIYVLDGLMKLRQICDSPQLLPDDENYGSESVKVEELVRNISEKTGNHKIVVFSQFITMLSIIRKRLEELNISYEYLDGKSSSKGRKNSVEHFQADEDCRVFLISLKAGGTGLNLTAADYVFIVDPWWNPAVEEQAIDRCYRIGQDKKVFAYRMICKDTIEEKIINYQQKKKALANDIIQAEEGFVKGLTTEDIKSLFS